MAHVVRSVNQIMGKKSRKAKGPSDKGPTRVAKAEVEKASCKPTPAKEPRRSVTENGEIARFTSAPKARLIVLIT